MSSEDKYIYDKLYKLLDNLFTLRQEKINKCKCKSYLSGNKYAIIKKPRI